MTDTGSIPVAPTKEQALADPDDQTGQSLASTCHECLSPFEGSHFGDCRIATGIKPAEAHRSCGDDRRNSGIEPPAPTNTGQQVAGESLRFGTLVRYELPTHGQSGFGCLIGVPHYSDGYDHVVMLANAECIGMPINRRWLRPTGYDLSSAIECRQRWEEAHPGFLKPANGATP